jgi:hypothetical protein
VQVSLGYSNFTLALSMIWANWIAPSVASHGILSAECIFACKVRDQSKQVNC